MLNPNKLLVVTANLIKDILSLEHSLSYILKNFYRNNNNKYLVSSEVKLVTETIYIFIRNYNKLTAVLPIAKLNDIIIYIWLNYLNITTQDLHKLNLPLNHPNLAKVTILNDIASDTELPKWLLDELLIKHDLDFIRQLATSMELPRSTLSLRVNVAKISRAKALKQLITDGYVASPSVISKYGINLANKPDLSHYELLNNGSLEVQSEASQLAGLLLNPSRGEMVADFGAGSGGKSLLFASIMRDSGRVYAIDNNQTRLKKLLPRSQRAGLNNIYPTLINDEHDPKLQLLANKMDKVFVDAPCSGSGTMGSHPELKLRYQLDDIKQLNKMQLSILVAASKLVKSQGAMVYATCSISSLENTQIIEEFLSLNPSFKIQPAINLLGMSNVCSKDGLFMELFPHIHHTEGFFAALLYKS